MLPLTKVVQPTGILDSIKVEQLRQEINELVKNKPTIILIDLQDVTFINSAGLGGLVAIFKTVRATGGKLFLCSINDQLKQVLELSKTNKIFRVFANKDEFYSQITSVN
ncbi:MAG: STAS domain-containing protein [Microcoleus sp. SIO2G3]|nr:STAS domain-containing protein [Microcoleus sp. SIO2G3]